MGTGEVGEGEDKGVGSRWKYLGRTRRGGIWGVREEILDHQKIYQFDCVRRRILGSKRTKEGGISACKSEEFVEYIWGYLGGAKGRNLDCKRKQSGGIRDRNLKVRERIIWGNKRGKSGCARLRNLGTLEEGICASKREIFGVINERCWVHKIFTRGRKYANNMEVFVGRQSEEFGEQDK